MKPHPRPTSLAALVGLASVAALAESQWPAWRGPLANGVAPDADPPVTWSETEHVAWKVAVAGRGTSTPVVWGDQVFLLTAVPEDSATTAPKTVEPPQDPPPGAPGEGRRRRGPGGPGGPGGPAGGGMVERPTSAQRFTVLSYDRVTGRKRWEQVARVQVPHEGHHKDHGFASASPVTDGTHLVVSFGSFGLYGYDMEGRKLWEKDLGDMRTRNSFGEGSSPALDGNTVVVLWDHEGEDFIAAFDKRDGKELWRQQRDEPTGWCTPLIVSHGGRKQVIVNGTNRVRAYDLATGEPLWEVGGQTANAIPSAVADSEKAYVMSGFRGAMLQAIRLGAKGDLSGTDAVAWTHTKSTPYVPSPLLYGDLLYFWSGNSALLSAFDAATGKAAFEAERVDGLNGVYASPLGAADRVYLVGRDGTTAVVRRGPKPEVLARNRLDDGFDASPAAVGNRLFLRGRENLYCLSGK